MNIADVVIIAIIAGFAVIGALHGFVRTVFKLGSFFISVLIAVKFNPIMTEWLMNGSIYTELKGSILKHILVNNAGTQVENAAQAENATRSIIEGLSLPGFVKNMLFSKATPGILDFTKLAESVSEELAGFIISVLSLVILFLIAKIILIFAGFLLSGLTKLPVLKQVDKAGGIVLGAVQGLLTVFVLLTLLALFGSSGWFTPVHEEISRSVIAGYLYENNFLIRYIIP